MIEIPRAALTADEIAKEAEFFSFGTNDLTQMTFGFSRDDAGKFLGAYYDKKIYENDPFAKPVSYTHLPERIFSHPGSFLSATKHQNACRVFCAQRNYRAAD